MPEAARFTDQISHTSAFAGLLIGVAAGLALAVAAVAIVGTGGVAAVAIGAGIAAAGAGGGLAGEYIGSAMMSPTGTIISGSANVIIGAMPAARAEIDQTLCSKDGPAPVPVAEGSMTVLINGMPAARKGDHTVCGAVISSGWGTVIIGGATKQMLEVHSEVPAWLHYGLYGVMIVGTIVATGGTAATFGWGPALGGLAGGLGGGALFGWIGGKAGAAIGRHYGNEELGKRIGEVGGGVLGSFLGGWLGGKLGGKFGNTYPEPTPGSNQAAQTVVDEIQNPANGIGSKQQQRMVVALDHGDGTYTVGISGNPNKAQAIINKIQPNMPPEVTLAPAGVDTSGLQPAVLPNGEPFPGGAACAEPKAWTGANGKPVVGQTTQWAGPPGTNPQPVEPGSPYANPCPSCDQNSSTIMNMNQTPQGGGTAGLATPAVASAPGAMNGSESNASEGQP